MFFLYFEQKKIHLFLEKDNNLLNLRNMKGLSSKSFLLLIFFAFLLSCNNSIKISEQDIEVIVEDESRPNFVTIKIPSTQTDKFDKIEWFLPNGEKISQLTGFTTYFPQKGIYVIKLSLSKNKTSVEFNKEVVIDKDDLYIQNGEKLVWNDEFNGLTLNNDWWINEVDVHVNNELQTYTLGDNINVANGILEITARRIGNGQKNGDYTSGRLKTQGKKEFTYGRMEIRAKLPEGIGTWPAIWMLGADINTIDWPACGEIDIMEHVGFDPGIIHSSLHSLSSWGATQNTAQTKQETFAKQYHIYGVNWTAEKLEFYIDSPANVFYSYHPDIKNNETWPFDRPFFFILNLAIGGHWGGKEGVDDTIFPVNMYVDYVRVYQKK